MRHRFARTSALACWWLCILSLGPGTIPSVTAVPPSFVNGNYTLECYNDATLTLSLILGGGNGNGNDATGGSEPVPIYCGPPNPTSPASLVTLWNEYQARLDAAATQFEAGCNQLVANWQLPPRPQECQAAAQKWRQALTELNDNSAGLAPALLRLVVIPGGVVEEITGIWSTWTTHRMKNGNILPIQYLVGRDGTIYSLAVLDGAVNLASDSAGCSGVLAVQSAGRLYGPESATPSRVVNDFAGLLTCGLSVGDLWIVVAATAQVHASSQSIPPTPPPEPAPVGPPPVPTPPGGPPPPAGICFSERSLVQTRDRGFIRMDELEIGDHVLTKDGSYDAIYSFAHKTATSGGSGRDAPFSEYMAIETTAMPGKPLEVSPLHLLYTANRTLVAAGQVRIGDLLLTAAVDPEFRVRNDRGGVVTNHYATVQSVQTVQRQGVYAPHTSVGHLVVNGIVASNYVAQAFPTNWSMERHAWVQHVACFPYRTYCRLWSMGCRDETYNHEGYPHWMIWVYNPVLQILETSQQWMVGRLFMDWLLMPLLWMIPITFTFLGMRRICEAFPMHSLQHV